MDPRLEAAARQLEHPTLLTAGRVKATVNIADIEIFTGMPPLAASWRQADSEATHRVLENVCSGSDSESLNIALAAWVYLLSTFCDVPMLTTRTASITVDEHVPQEAGVPPKWRLTMERTIEIALDRPVSVKELLATLSSTPQEPPGANSERNLSYGFYYEPRQESVPSSLLVLPADIHETADLLPPLDTSIFELSRDLLYDIVIRLPAHAAHDGPVFEPLFDGQTQDETHVR